MNPIGITTWIWTSPLTTDKFKEVASHIKTLGFDLIEVPIESTGDLDYAFAALQIRELGLSASVCAAMSPDRDLIHQDERIRQNAMAYVRHCIDAAQTIGATNVVGPLYSAVGRTWQATPDERKKDIDLLVGELKQLAAYAGERGVVLCVEPLNRFETSFLNLAEQAIEIVDRVGHPACGLLLDTFHMNIEERSVGAAIRSAGSRLKHLHACENDRGAPGSGHVQWDEVVRACRDINYQGPAVIESFTAAVKSIARAAAIWRPLAATQDGLAQDGLRHLRKVFGQAQHGSPGH
jgi:D-psicose/D-tagatose/L-ribulose 3-epimerase